MEQGMDLSSLSSGSDVAVAKAEIEKQAQQHAERILCNIERVNRRIYDARQQAEKAKNMKTSVWKIWKTAEKTDVLAELDMEIVDTQNEMNILIQESIDLTCRSIQFARAMHKTMAQLMVAGFRDTNGCIIKLSCGAEEFANRILNRADDFIKRQEDVEIKQSELGQEINKLEILIRQRDLKQEATDKAQHALNEAIKEQQKVVETKQSELAEEIKKFESRFKKQDLIDQEQTDKLNKINAVLGKQKSINEVIETKQSELAEEVKKQESRFKKKDLIDKGQTDQLNKIKEALDKQKLIDEEQTERLNLLNNLLDDTKISIEEKQEKSLKIIQGYMQTKQKIDEKQEAEIEYLKLKIKQLKLTMPALVISIIGLFIAITAIVIVIFK